ncbi:MAG TPA: isoprenylcysteine carboxylmethyltransferase family protein [Gammaproteobacteria bacterium]|nr:isoprenylcysteine carboxylmethyltransferase family protein [Gammaproteobacteria bacterium]
MNIYPWLIPAFWLVFIAYWVVMAFSAKRSLGSRDWHKQIGYRLLILFIVLIALRFPGSRRAMRVIVGYRPDELLGLIGAVICGLGVAFAIWARTVLGRNWGMPMSHKQDPELVTGGPYAYVRHPIYTGVLFALLGSAIGQNLVWCLPLLPAVAYFVYSARQEEKLMLQQFPQQYRAYMQRSKMLLPFLY